MILCSNVYLNNYHGNAYVMYELLIRRLYLEYQGHVSTCTARSAI